MSNHSIPEQKEHQEPTLKEKTAKGFFWGGISSFLQQLIGLLFGIIISRILTNDDYGLVAMLAIFTALAGTFADSGFSSALINRKTIEHKDYNAVFWFSLIMSVTLYIALFFSAPLIAAYYNEPILVKLSRLSFLSFLFSGMGVAHNALLIKKIMVKERGIIDMVSVFFSGMIGVILALNGFAFWGIAIQQVSQSLITTMLRWYFSRWRPTFHFDFSPIKRMFSYSFKLLITDIFTQITNNILSVVFGRTYGKSITGYYAQGNKWATYGSFTIVGTFNSVAQPVLVEARSDIKRQVNVFRKMLRFGALITFPLLLGFAFVGKEFILITIGEKWLESVIFMQILCIWGINSYLQSLYTILMWSHEKSGIYMNVKIFLFISQIIVLFFCLSYDILVIICAFVILYYLSTLLFHYYANKIIGLRFADVIKDLLPYASATIIAIAVAWVASYKIDNLYLKIITKIIVTATVYIAILWRGNSVILKESLQYLKKRRI